MSNLFHGYRVTSNHATGLYPANVRVKDCNGVIVAHVAGKRGDMLVHVRKHPLSDECAKFKAQLAQNDVPESVVKLILAVVPTKGK